MSELKPVRRTSLRRLTLIFLGLCTVAGLVACRASNGRPRHAAPPHAAPPTAVPSTAATPTPLFSGDGRYAFPVAGDLSLMHWTRHHWDGSNAADIEAQPDLAADSAEFQAFIRLPVAAVTAGAVRVADNPAGGLAYWLHGDDGFRYYYGHLSEQWATDGQRVAAGELIGRIGNTGRWTQYLEPHLHFAITSPQARNGRFQPDVNAAEQFQVWFGLPWQELSIADYPPDRVGGAPLAGEWQISRTFAENRSRNPDQGAIDLQPVGGNEPLPVYATVGGEVNVSRATVMGLRVQVTNRPGRTTVVFSGLLDTPLRDGDVVARGDIVGRLDPAGSLNYMLFVNGVQSDPTPTLNPR